MDDNEDLALFILNNALILQKGHWNGHDTKQKILQTLFRHEYTEDDVASENFGLPEFNKDVASMYNSLIQTKMDI